MKNRRPVNARKMFIDAVTEEMKALAKDYNHEVAKGLWPFIKIADRMAHDDLERLDKKRARVMPPRREAAE